MPVSITIPAGASSYTETIVPVVSTTYVGSETILLTLATDPSYTVGSASSATINMAGNAVPINTIKATGASVTLTWASTVGKTYRVAYKSTVSASAWTDLSGTLTATNTSTSYADTTANKTTQRYYLVYVTN
jgi:uncharacterized protein YigE (DUF2233 family)